ncbi:universal stress protein [Amycolatopsis panacis]|uniref:Universal stress protein n=1 Tax=Amycolatopsis panacis TaxID=2340917 RepID=A0A419I708_9PSEU|nr:universal stress protein [Amycolatopsis panacis]RJQ87259.1 universal stress protein [Amycolatopsis panacis]
MKPVVVGVDGSATATAAAQWAAREAKLRHTPLTVLMASGFGDGGFGAKAHTPVAWRETKETLAGQLLRTIRDDLAAAEPGVRITAEMSPADPETALRHASGDACLLVLGKPTGTLSGLLAGSPDLDLVARAQCPVVVVRGQSREGGPVVVGVDGSPFSEAAIAQAFEEASLHEVSLVALHTWLDGGASRLCGEERGDFPAAIREAERQVLVERLAGWRERYPDIPVERVVEQDRPRDRLLDRSADASLMVLGSRGRGGFTGMVLGSTSHALLHHAACPVLVSRPHTTESRIAEAR